MVPPRSGRRSVAPGVRAAAPRLAQRCRGATPAPSSSRPGTAAGGRRGPAPARPRGARGPAPRATGPRPGPVAVWWWGRAPPPSPRAAPGRRRGARRPRRGLPRGAGPDVGGVGGSGRARPARRRAVRARLARAPPSRSWRAGPLVTAPRAAERRGWPAVEVIDRRGDDPRTGLFSERLVRLVRGRDRRAGGRVVCVVNRTGRVRLLSCAACGELARCETCGAAVELVGTPGTTATAGRPRRRCRAAPRTCVAAAAGSERPVVCARCGAHPHEGAAPRVSRGVREDLEALAGVPVAEVWGPARPGGKTSRVRRARVVVGTEAALHRVPRCRCRGVLGVRRRAARPSLPGRRAGPGPPGPGRPPGGRCGRRPPRRDRAPGRVVVQTRQPRHPALVAAVAADPGVLAGGRDRAAPRPATFPRAAPWPWCRGRRPTPTAPPCGRPRPGRVEVTGPSTARGRCVRPTTPRCATCWRRCPGRRVAFGSRSTRCGPERAGSAPGSQRRAGGSRDGGRRYHGRHVEVLHPTLRRPRAAPAGRRGRRHRRAAQAAGRRHGADHVRGARCRPGRAPGGCAEADVRLRHRRRAGPVHGGEPGARRGSGGVDLRRGLPVGARICRGPSCVPRRSTSPGSTSTATRSRSRPTSSWPGCSSTRSTTSTACCSSSGSTRTSARRPSASCGPGPWACPTPTPTGCRRSSPTSRPAGHPGL